MFKLVARLSIFFALGLAVCCAGSTAAGYLRGDPSGLWQAHLLDKCPLPCWAGITLGETSFARAEVLLARYLPAGHQIIASPSQLNFIGSSTSSMLGGYVFYRGGTVDDLRLTVEMPIALLITALGSPDCVLPVALTGGEQRLTVYWEMNDTLIGAMFAAHDRALRPSSTVIRLWMSAHETACNRVDLKSWAGFAPMWRYF